MGQSDRKQTDAEFTSELTVYFTGLLQYISHYQEHEVFGHSSGAVRVEVAVLGCPS